MNFVSIRVITADAKRLVSFYETITGLSATWGTNDFAEIATPGCTLAIGSARAVPADAVRPADNHSVIVEFRVRDVDEEFRKLAAVIDTVVQEPMTMPWGNRSLLFRDPDGNLVNLFAPVTETAIERYEKVT